MTDIDDMKKSVDDYKTLLAMAGFETYSNELRIADITFAFSQAVTEVVVKPRLAKVFFDSVELAPDGRIIRADMPSILLDARTHPKVKTKFLYSVLYENKDGSFFSYVILREKNKPDVIVGLNDLVAILQKNESTNPKAEDVFTAIDACKKTGNIADIVRARLIRAQTQSASTSKPGH